MEIARIVDAGTAVECTECLNFKVFFLVSETRSAAFARIHQTCFIFPSGTKMKTLLWIIGIIFLSGLLAVSGVLKMIF